MDFVHYDLGQLHPGQAVEVTLGVAANVLLLDPPNFNAYRSGQRYTYFGGHISASPYRIGIPHAAHWHVAIDLGGAAGNIRSSVQIIGT